MRRASIAILSVLAVLAAGLGVATPAQAVPGTGSNVFINEIHYDNAGTDSGEAVEVAARAGTDLSAWSIVRYNRSTPTAAVTYAFPAATNGLGAATDSGNGWGFVVVNYPSNGLQNGPNDGVALVNGSGSVVQLLSYAGVFTASNGPAAGMTSTDVGVVESGTTTPVGFSLQLSGGPGNDPNDFTWGAASASTFGQANTGQTFISVGDSAPAVTSTSPANNATDVPVNGNVTVTFSEPVTTAAATFELTCANSGPHAVSVNAGTTTYSLDPTTDFSVNELCTLTVVGAQLHDVDGDDPPDTMTADHTVSFRTVPPAPSCDDPDTKLSAVQGPGTASPVVGQVVTVQAVVTAVRSGLTGFFLQEEVADQDDSPATSEGVFVRTATPPAGLTAGDVVQVTGGVREFASTTGAGSSQTQISDRVSVLSCGHVTDFPPAGVLEFPVAQFTDFEHFEGMRVTMPQPLVISEYFNYGRFNETVVGLPPNGRSRFDSPTAVQEPDTTATTLLLADYANRRITLDDGRSSQNPSPPYFPGMVETPFTLTNTFRGGDTLKDVTGVMEHTFGLYRIHPTVDATYTSANPRPLDPPAVGGDTKIASFNVLNYFLSLNAGTFNCGPARNQECRGANNENERQRQRAKIIAAMAKINADVFGLMEMENTPSVEPGADLAAGLNDATAPGTYSYIDTGVIGTDAIRVGLLYKTAKMTPVGPFKVLNTSVDPRFIDTRNRPTLAQTFQRAGSGERITIAVNHLKSKGSACPGDPDTGDGAGNCNITRTNAAKALSDWLATDPAHSGDPDRLIIGDLNSYDHEDPIDALVAGGYTDLVKKYGGEYAYSYVFDGQVGYLDHGLSSPTLVPQVTGAGDWHINADEPTILDYDTSFKADSEDALYEPKAYRASDHDPVIVGMELGVRQCEFADNAATSTRTLLADCDTSRTILVPDGWTLDGAGHSITAKDPADGHFLGAVVRNAGASANVRNLTVTASSLNDVCDDGDNRLRGILLDGASGSILNNHVLGINQGASGCQEGNGIEVRNAPFDTTGVDKVVLISGNEVRDYQKGGIVANGSVNVSVVGNTVDGVGPINYIAQNGIQVAFGGTGVVESNTVTDNFYTGPDLGCGLLFFEADGVKQKKNTFAGNEKDICNFGRGGGSSPTKK
ncbi:MAG: ExeM/NucH family extracellular endonuclease [Sporichthyaceae bacterium]